MLEPKVRGFECHTQPKEVLCWKRREGPKAPPLDTSRDYVTFLTFFCKQKLPRLIFSKNHSVLQA